MRTLLTAGVGITVVLLTGCGSKVSEAPEREPKPVVATVKIKVPGMT